jgi:oxygen-independent coproporphyrinogen-3 oxidase
VAIDSVGVYVHVPFCERVCPYCDFAVVAARRLPADREARYVDALLAELELRRVAFAGATLVSLYLGGGTPSLLTPAALGRVIDAVRSAFPADAPEISMEVNPSTVERDRLPGFREVGVNRVSLGVQSFDDEVLKRLGRAHRADEARRTLASARAAGFDALSVDLIHAAPGQTLQRLERDLEEVVDFRPEHVSGYELTVEPGTPFHLAARRGQLSLPSEELAVAMLELLEALLDAAGYERYELSNYARPGFASVHNRRYWERQPVLGLGVGAHSLDPPSAGAPFGIRRANTRRLDAYLAQVDARRPAEDTSVETLDAATARGEAAFLALRSTRGLAAARFTVEFGRSPRGFWEPAIERLVAEGLLEENAGGDLRLTRRGRLLADPVFQHFI